MEIFKLIKERRTIRKYKDRAIPKKIINKIVKAGVWGPSVIIFQPWKFVVIENMNIRDKIHDALEDNSKKLDMAGRIVLNPTKMAIKNSKFLIAVYNSGDFIKFTSRFSKIYTKATRISEISAISAAIQNMILTAASLGIGSCWLDTPLLYEQKLNKIFGIKSCDELVAILTFGYADEKGKRAPRKPLSKMIKYLK